jgi:ABC-2 type transport system permease protein
VTVTVATGNRWAGTLAFTRTEFWVQLHEELALVSSMIVQAVLLLFVVILDRGLLPYALIGAVLYSIFMLGQRVQNEAAYIRIDHRLTELYHASPLTPEGYFLGMSAGMLLAYSPPILAFVVLTEYVDRLTPLGGLALGLAAGALWLFTCSMGYFISTLFETNRAIWPYASIITNVFGVLPPVFYPLTVLAPATQPFALLLPTSSAVALVEWAQGGLLTFNGGLILEAAVVLPVEAVAFFVFTAWWARRASRER